MKSRPAAIAFIFVTVMLDMLALGLIAPVLPKLILDFRGGNAVSAATWLGWFGTIFAAMQFFLFPSARRVVGSLRSASSHLTVEPRSRSRLHRNGALADNRLA